MKYKIWDKKEKINNVNAEYVIESLNVLDTDEVFLILDDYDNVQAIEIGRIIKGVYGLDRDLTIEEVAEEYIRIKEEERLQAEKEQMTLEVMSEKLNELIEENNSLKQGLRMLLTEEQVRKLNL